MDLSMPSFPFHLKVSFLLKKYLSFFFTLSHFSRPRTSDILAFQLSFVLNWFAKLHLKKEFWKYLRWRRRRSRETNYNFVGTLVTCPGMFGIRLVCFLNIFACWIHGIAGKNNCKKLRLFTQNLFNDAFPPRSQLGEVDLALKILN